MNKLDSIVFLHDNFITLNDSKLYSNGSLNLNVIERYNRISKKFTISTREDFKRNTRDLSFIGDTSNLSFIGLPNFNRVKNLKRLTKKISKVIANHNTVIIRLPSFIGFISMFLAKRSSKNIIVELVGCPLDTFRQHSAKGYFLSFFLYFITKYYLKTANNVLYVTSSFLQKRYPSKAINQIGCSDVEIKIDNDILAKRLKKLSVSKVGKITIGMIGFLEAKYKGFDVALKSLSYLLKSDFSNFCLEVVGGGNDSMIKKIIKENGLENYVYLKGSLSHPDEIFNWLDNVDIYIHPSKTEGLPRSLIEAMSRGCACIASNVGGIPELIDAKYLHNKQDAYHLSLLIKKHITLSNRIENIKNCFLNSSNYDKIILDKKRQDFYNKCINLK